MELHKAGILAKHRVEMIGANRDAITRARIGNSFKQCMLKIGLDVAKSMTVHTLEDARKAADYIGTMPLIIRPVSRSAAPAAASPTPRGVRADREHGWKFPGARGAGRGMLLGWKEYEMEVMRDHKDQCVVICSIENFDPMGVHTGDSITVAPAMTLTDKEFQVMRDASFAVIREVGVATGGSTSSFPSTADRPAGRD